MNMRRKPRLSPSLAACMASAVTLGLGCLAARPQDAQREAVSAGRHLVYTLRPLKPPPAPGQSAAYLPGEPVIVECSLSNVGTETAEVLWMVWARTKAHGENGPLPSRNARLARAEWEAAGVDPEHVRELVPGASLRKVVDLTRWQVFPAEGTCTVVGTYVIPPPSYALRDPGVTAPKLFLRAKPVVIRIVPTKPGGPPWEETHKALEQTKNLAVGVAPDLEAGHFAEGTRRALALLAEQVLDSDSYLAEWGYYYAAVFKARCVASHYADVATLPDAVAAFNEFLGRYPESICAELMEGALMALQENTEPVPLGLPSDRYRL